MRKFFSFHAIIYLLVGSLTAQAWVETACYRTLLHVSKTAREARDAPTHKLEPTLNRAATGPWWQRFTTNLAAYKSLLARSSNPKLIREAFASPDTPFDVSDPDLRTQIALAQRIGRSHRLAVDRALMMEKGWRGMYLFALAAGLLQVWGDEDHKKAEEVPELPPDQFELIFLNYHVAIRVGDKIYEYGPMFGNAQMTPHEKWLAGERESQVRFRFRTDEKEVRALGELLEVDRFKTGFGIDCSSRAIVAIHDSTSVYCAPPGLQHSPGKARFALKLQHLFGNRKIIAVEHNSALGGNNSKLQDQWQHFWGGAIENGGSTFFMPEAFVLQAFFGIK